jgi:Histidine kinase/PAS fold
MFRKQFTDVQDAWLLAHAIVDTVREPLVVLDQDLRVVAASQSFYLTFKVEAENTLGKLLYDLGDGQWDIPKLRVLLGKILPEQGAMENYDVEHDFPGIGKRTMLLNARKVFYEKGSHSTILLGIEDVTQKRTLEKEKDDLIRQKEMLLEELEHRVVNSLQIIASIIMLKARAVESEETRRHLEDAHNRVISVATVQKHLHGSAANSTIEMGPYLATLCTALAKSMISDDRLISIKFDGKGGLLPGAMPRASVSSSPNWSSIPSSTHSRTPQRTARSRSPMTYPAAIGSLLSPTTVPANLTACSLSPKPGLVLVLSKRWQNNSMLKW